MRRRAERRAISLKAVAIATLIVLVFALFGQPILNQLGVSLPALQVAGGIILLMIALDMTLSKRPSQAKLTAKESEEAENKAEAHAEITVFPLATPLLAGPGAMTCAIVLAASTKGRPEATRRRSPRNPRGHACHAIFLLLAQEIHYLIGVTARKVIVRVFGVLLAAIAVQSIFNGIAADPYLPLKPQPKNDEWQRPPPRGAGAVIRPDRREEAAAQEAADRSGWVSARYNFDWACRRRTKVIGISMTRMRFARASNMISH